MANSQLIQAVRQQLTDAGLADHLDEILAYARPAIDVFLAAPSNGAPGESRFGGAPDLPPSVLWPHTPEGKALTFLLQINLSDLPPFEGNPLPSQGMLYFFVGFVDLYLDIKHRVILWQGEEPLQTASVPNAEEFADDYYLNLPPHQLRFALCLDLPLWGNKESESLVQNLPPKARDSIWSMERNEEGRLCQLWGYPLSFVQDAREDAYGVREVTSNWLDGYTHGSELDLSGIMRWQLLMRLYSQREPEFMLGDIGFVNVLIRDDDLAALNFQNTFVGLQDT